ncbi:hypothetical protein EAF00_000596 [Botryotinia globosa]|nr:hypothetical protein EAF00_000596 [Botryotinia globosa]
MLWVDHFPRFTQEVDPISHDSSQQLRYYPLKKMGLSFPLSPTKEQFLEFSRDPASAVRMQVGTRSVLVYPWTIIATSNLIQFYLLDLYSIVEYLYYIPNFCSRKGTWRKTPFSFRRWLMDDQSGNSSRLVLSTVYSITNDIYYVLSKLVVRAG